MADLTGTAPPIKFMHYFGGISTSDLAKELVKPRHACFSRSEPTPTITEEQRFSPVFVEIDGVRTQIFGVNWDKDKRETILMGISI